MASAMVINSYSSTLENRGTWQTKKTQNLFGSKFYSSYQFPIKDSGIKQLWQRCTNIFKYHHLRALFQWSSFSWTFHWHCSTSLRKLDKVSLRPAAASWLDESLQHQGTERQKIRTLMMLLKLSRSNSHKMPFSLQITVASRIGKFKEKQLSGKKGN